MTGPNRVLAGPAPSDTDETYQGYVETYNKLTGLMAEEKGVTPEVQQAYEEYLEAKRAYEEALEKVQEKKEWPRWGVYLGRAGTG
ncbi:MAG: hypothetical protein ACOC88_02900 [Candidatus Bipolaricaulota bacterium]